MRPGWLARGCNCGYSRLLNSTSRMMRTMKRMMTISSEDMGEEAALYLSVGRNSIFVMSMSSFVCIGIALGTK